MGLGDFVCRDIGFGMTDDTRVRWICTAMQGRQTVPR